MLHESESIWIMRRASPGTLCLSSRFLLRLFGALVVVLATMLVVASPGVAQQDGPNLSFEVTTEGEPDPDVAFFGTWIQDPTVNPNGEIPPPRPDAGWNSVRLTDPDEDGVYEGGEGVDETGEYLVAIFKFTGAEGEEPVGPNSETDALYELISQQSIVAKDASITLDGDRTISTSYDFSEDSEDTATLAFDVDTEGNIPEDTTFFGFSGYVGEPFSPLQLTDPDGDGTYTASRELERGAEIRVKIEQGSGTRQTYNALAGRELTVPGEPRTVIEGPRTITLDEDTAVSTTVAVGQDGVQPVIGTESAEALYGDYGNDTIEGRGGDDLIVGEAGADAIMGGEGDDFLVAAYAYFQSPPDAPASPDYVSGGPGNDLIDAADLAGEPGSGTNDTVECGPGDDLVYAGVQDTVADDCEVVYRYPGF